MSDLSETYKAMREHSQEKRAKNREFAINYLLDNDVDFGTRNGGVHLMVECGVSGIIDFWPGTGKWIERGGKTGRGIKTMVKYIKSKTKEEQ